MRPGLRQRGLAAVEVAIAAPLFLLLMAATAELGRAFYSYNILTKSVREGARYLAAHALNGAGVVDLGADRIAAAKNLVVYGSPAAGANGSELLPGLAPASVTWSAVDVQVGTLTSTQISVSVSYAYVPLWAAIPTFGYGAAGAVGTLTAIAVMRAM